MVVDIVARARLMQLAPPRVPLANNKTEGARVICASASYRAVPRFPRPLQVI